jgi:hypothetical protein
MILKVGKQNIGMRLIISNSEKSFQIFISYIVAFTFLFMVYYQIFFYDKQIKKYTTANTQELWKIANNGGQTMNWKDDCINKVCNFKGYILNAKDNF